MAFDQQAFIRRVYPLHRTLVSDGTHETLEIIGQALPEAMSPHYRILGYPSGEKAWTWTTPHKYIVHEAWLRDGKGRLLVDFAEHPLHLASYSKAFEGKLSLAELDPHLHSSEKRPKDIPWKFLYYVENWGLCLPHEQRLQLDPHDTYHVKIDVRFEKAALEVGELVWPGRDGRELLIVTDVCHPCQVNDSITGVSAVLAMLHELGPLQNMGLRVLFVPETIGSICYFAHNEDKAAQIFGGFFTEMLGNDRSLALQHSFQADSYIDRVARHIFNRELDTWRAGPFRTIVGNDELVTNAPPLNIPTISISRSKVTGDSFDGYHTSADTPDNLIPANLEEAAALISALVALLEADYIPRRQYKGPVFLSGHDLWGIWGDMPQGKEYVDQIMYLMEGELSVFDIAEKIAKPFPWVKSITDAFEAKGLIQRIPVKKRAKSP